MKFEKTKKYHDLKVKMPLVDDINKLSTNFKMLYDISYLAYIGHLKHEFNDLEQRCSEIEQREKHLPATGELMSSVVYKMIGSGLIKVI